MNNFALLDLGTPQLIIILVIVLLLFGSKKLPELARSLGSSVGELRKGIDEGAHDKKKTASKSVSKSSKKTS